MLFSAPPPLVRLSLVPFRIILDPPTGPQDRSFFVCSSAPSSRDVLFSVVPLPRCIIGPASRTSKQHHERMCCFGFLPLVFSLPGVFFLSFQFVFVFEGTDKNHQHVPGVVWMQTTRNGVPPQLVSTVSVTDW